MLVNYATTEGNHENHENCQDQESDPIKTFCNRFPMDIDAGSLGRSSFLNWLRPLLGRR